MTTHSSDTALWDPQYWRLQWAITEKIMEVTKIHIQNIYYTAKRPANIITKHENMNYNANVGEKLIWLLWTLKVLGSSDWAGTQQGRNEFRSH